MNEQTTALRQEFPLLWDMSVQYDFAERLGGCTDPLLTEADAAMRELWSARSNLARASVRPKETSGPRFNNQRSTP